MKNNSSKLAKQILQFLEEKIKKHCISAFLLYILPGLQHLVMYKSPLKPCKQRILDVKFSLFYCCILLYYMI